MAIFPFENYSDTKDAEKVVDALLVPALGDTEIFAEIEDTRFVRDVLKKLKITATDILDREVLKKLGEEMNIQGIIYGKIVNYGKGREKESAPQVTMDMVLVEPSTGSVLVVGNVTAYGGLTAGKVFGVTEGKTDIEVARDAIRRLVSSFAYEIRAAREKERKGIVAEMKNEEELERVKLEKLKGETGKLQGELDKARKEADTIKSSAVKEVEAIKTDLEMQKAAIDSEKAKGEAERQAVEQEKLKVEIEKKKIEEEKKKMESESKKAVETPPVETPPKEEPLKEELLKETVTPAPSSSTSPKEVPANVEVLMPAPPAPATEAVPAVPSAPAVPAEATPPVRKRGERTPQTTPEPTPEPTVPAPSGVPGQ